MILLSQTLKRQALTNAAQSSFKTIATKTRSNFFSCKRRSHSGGFKNRIHRKQNVNNELCNDIAFSNLETTSADECSSKLF